MCEVMWEVAATANILRTLDTEQFIIFHVNEVNVG